MSMGLKGVERKINEKSVMNKKIYEYIAISLISLCLLALTVGVLLIAIKTNPNKSNVIQKTIGQLLWEAIKSGPSWLLFILELIVNFLLFKYVERIRKGRIILFSFVFYIVAIFNYIAIEIALETIWVVFANLVPVVFIAVISLFQRREIAIVSQSNGIIATELNEAFSDTKNRNIIAVQLYKVETSQKDEDKDSDIVKFQVTHFGDDFVRPGYDINSISKITYEMDRTIVDAFPMILNYYYEFRESGDEEKQRITLNFINQKVDILESKLKKINEEQREVTKYDCCLARALTILLSFKKKLVPDSETKETQDDYIGEISLQDGELNLDAEIEEKLFSLYRTGIFGAALLDTESRHVFYYRKNGVKSGRMYSASQILCINHEGQGTFTGQTMYICLFTIKKNGSHFIPGFMFKSIQEREKHIREVLNKMNKGGD